MLPLLGFLAILVLLAVIPGRKMSPLAALIAIPVIKGTAARPCGIELSEHQRFTVPFLFATSVFMTFMAVAFGLFPI
jgi:Mg2+/citrate symporter